MSEAMTVSLALERTQQRGRAHTATRQSAHSNALLQGTQQRAITAHAATHYYSAGGLKIQNVMSHVQNNK